MGGEDDGGLLWHTGALYHRPDPVEQVDAVRPEVDLHPLERARLLRFAGIDADHLAVLEQHACCGDARTRQADHQVRAVGKRRAPAQETDCWYSVKPIAEQIAATIQKRRMIFVSDQASSSKW